MGLEEVQAHLEQDTLDRHEFISAILDVMKGVTILDANSVDKAVRFRVNLDKLIGLVEDAKRDFVRLGLLIDFGDEVEVETLPEITTTRACELINKLFKDRTLNFTDVDIMQDLYVLSSILTGFGAQVDHVIELGFTPTGNLRVDELDVSGRRRIVSTSLRREMYVPKVGEE